MRVEVKNNEPKKKKIRPMKIYHPKLTFFPSEYKFSFSHFNYLDTYLDGTFGSEKEKFKSFDLLIFFLLRGKKFVCAFAWVANREPEPAVIKRFSFIRLNGKNRILFDFLLCYGFVFCSWFYFYFFFFEKGGFMYYVLRLNVVVRNSFFRV